MNLRLFRFCFSLASSVYSMASAAFDLIALDLWPVFRERDYAILSWIRLRTEMQKNKKGPRKQRKAMAPVLSCILRPKKWWAVAKKRSLASNVFVARMSCMYLFVIQSLEKNMSLGARWSRWGVTVRSCTVQLQVMTLAFSMNLL